MPPIPVVCPHCQAPNATPGKFCAACGRALPEAVKSAPRVIGRKSGEFARSGAGQAMQLDELGKQAKSASGILLTLAAIGGVYGTIVLLVGLAGGENGEVDPRVLQIAGVVFIVMAIIYLSLGIWAKKNPLPAAITGLVLYSSYAVLDVVATLNSEQPAFAPGAIAIKVFIIAALARAVSAGVKYRQLKQRRASMTPGFPGGTLPGDSSTP